MGERYALESRGPDRFDIVHYSRDFVAGRMMTLREIVRANIPAAEVRQGGK
ncbi:hypothetical protein PMI01_00954 [Caulobacter sp. AP07]|uniref:hypothetical protein n=1 Tax=Caulobacter sp. AP07 TaxID=1144304 RepID=UPI0002721AD7|nr:hypothetical protein [Caulobacter sp. AP07]EJL36579.1 hypothetical protein PMI01_00954 [Caulobacter sp. AP07]